MLYKYTYKIPISFNVFELKTKQIMYPMEYIEIFKNDLLLEIVDMSTIYGNNFYIHLKTNKLTVIDNRLVRPI